MRHLGSELLFYVRLIRPHRVPGLPRSWTDSLHISIQAELCARFLFEMGHLYPMTHYISNASSDNNYITGFGTVYSAIARTRTCNYYKRGVTNLQCNVKSVPPYSPCKARVYIASLFIQMVYLTASEVQDYKKFCRGSSKTI